MWIFGSLSGTKYSDNTKYLFEYMNENHSDIRCIWLTKNRKTLKEVTAKNYECYLSNSLKGIYYSLRAKAVFLTHSNTDVNMFAINGATIFQLWHGMPSKKIGNTIGYESEKYQDWLNTNIFSTYYQWDYMMSTADIFTQQFIKYFDCIRQGYIHSGQPRVDAFASKIEDKLIRKYQQKFEKAKFILYAPTFRDSLNVSRRNIEIEGFFDCFTPYGFNQEETESFLDKNNIILFIKRHPFESLNQKNGNRIIYIDDDAIEDTNSLLKNIDLLITDYSGIYYDFLLTQKPLIFAPFDFEDYKEHRDLYFNYYKDFAFCGEKIYNWGSIFDKIEEILISGKDEFIEDRKVANTRFNQYYSEGENCKKVYEFIQEKL